jgi:hypothetical protein
MAVVVGLAGCGEINPSSSPFVDDASELDVGFVCADLDCDDGVACTADSCTADEGCVHTARDVDCDDGISCTDEVCDVVRGCIVTPQTRLCDDGIDCTVDVCDVGEGCRHVADSLQCESGMLCRPGDGGCVQPPPCDGVDDPRCDDGQDCSTDSCDLATGRCVHSLDHGQCSDGEFCNGEEQCAPFLGCQMSFGPACDDGLVCTVDRCDEEADRCERTPDDRLCSDGVFCNGAEICSLEDKRCVPGMPPGCDDGADCTADACDAQLDRCVNLPDDAECDDGLWCNGPERCRAFEGCREGTAPDCTDDDVCTQDLCDEEADVCAHPAPEEICNEVDDDCDGEIDEGVQSTCGDCDVTCQGERIGQFGRDWDADGLDGARVDEDRGGVVITVSIRENDWLWIPNTARSTLSRWDPDGVVEVSRYRVGLPEGECAGQCCHEYGCNMPSRVVVDGRGDAYVANRGFDMQGTVTKVAGSLEDCVDRNNNGLIDTSTSDELLDYGEDECVLYTVPVGEHFALLRGLAIDGGDETFPQGYVWVGGYNSRQWHKLNPVTGETLATMDVAHQPYSGVVTSDGGLWSATLRDDTIVSINTRTHEVSEPIPFPEGRSCDHVNHSYGLTVDHRDRLWLSGAHCDDALGYDPSLQQWTRVDTTSLRLPTIRGITVDASGNVYMLAGNDTGRPYLYIWDSDDFVPGGTIVEHGALLMPSPVRGSSGLGFDRDGNLWALFFRSNHLVRLNPRTLALRTFTGPDGPYTYSDFTGSVRRGVFGAGLYEDILDAGCDDPEWRELRWDVEVPEGGRTALTLVTAPTREGLAGQPVAGPLLLPGAQSPASVPELLDRAGLGHDRFLRLNASMNQNPEGESPVMRYLQATWTCP